MDGLALSQLLPDYRGKHENNQLIATKQIMKELNELYIGNTI